MTADFQAAELRLADPEDPARGRLPPRQRLILAAMAALDGGSRDAVLVAADQARSHGEPDIAWLLELLAGQRPLELRKVRELPGEGEVPELLHALQSWRAGRPRADAATLRRLVDHRPALRGLLGVLDGRERLTVRGLERLSPRAVAVLAAARHGLLPKVSMDEVLAELLPVDLNPYRSSSDPVQLSPLLQDWLADPQLGWNSDRALACLYIERDRPELIALVLGALLRAIHHRLAAGRSHGLLGPIHGCRLLAEALPVRSTLARHLGVLEHRLEALLEPDEALLALSALWQRSTDWTVAERRVIARHLAGAISRRLDDDAAPPGLLAIAREALTYLITTTGEAGQRAHLLEQLGWLVPDAQFFRVTADLEPWVRTSLLADRALRRGDTGAALAAVVALARAPEAGEHASKLLVLALNTGLGGASRHLLRQLERTLAALLAMSPRHLDPLLLPTLLAATVDLQVGVEAARALVAQELERALADDDPRLAYHVVARHLLGDEGGAQVLVDRIHRELRRLDPDLADDLALDVVSRVLDDPDLGENLPTLRRLVAPLSDFILREGPERPLRAAKRLAAATSERAAAYGAWAREYRAQLDDIPYWHALIELAESTFYEDDDDYYDDDDDDDDDREIPF